MILSNSKLPFSATGENVSSLDWPLRIDLEVGGLIGGTSVRPAPGMFLGAEGDATWVIIDRCDSQLKVEEDRCVALSSNRRSS